MVRFILVAETGSDITPEVAKDLGIEIVPMHVNFGGHDLDDGSFPPEDLYENYRRTKELPHTSGSTPQDFTRAFNRIHAEHPEAQVVYLAYSSVTTVSYASALAAAEGRDYVTAIDTKSVSAGQGMVVTNTARWLKANPEATLDELKAFVDDQVARIRMSFIPGDLEYLRAGGRLSNIAFLGATLLRIKPTVEIQDGRLVATDKRRGSRLKCIVALTRHFLEAEPLDAGRISFIYSVGDAPDPTEREAVEQLAHEHGFKRIEWVKTGCVIASHSGPGAFGIVAMAKGA